MQPFGQHFLHDKNIIKKIIRLSGAQSGDHVLEIGPGKGALTKALLAGGAHVLAVEIDKKLGDGLIHQFSSENFELLLEDALVGKHKLNPHLLDRLKDFFPYKLISNLPYSAGTPILLNLWQSSFTPVSGLVMVQEEVGDRLVAGPGSKSYGALSVIMANVAVCKKETVVSRTCFSPPPQVSSCLVSLATHSPKVDGQKLREVVQLAFAQRRKKLTRLLKEGFNLEAAEIDPNCRPEDISPEKWFALAQTVKKS